MMLRAIVVSVSENECPSRLRRGHFQEDIEFESETITMQRQVIEFGGLPVGIAVPDNDRLRFIAVKFHVIDLDNRLFSTAAELKAAIGRHLHPATAIAA